MTRILITSIGATGAQGVVKGFRALGDKSIKLIGTDYSEVNAGKFMVDAFETLPLGTDPNFIEQLLHLVEFHRIDILIPIMEREIEAVARNRDRFACMVVCSEPETIELCNDKIKLQQYLINKAIRMPKIHSVTSELQFPVIAKPRSGTGSIGIKICKDLSGFYPEFFNEEKYIVQSYIKGTEYSVDTYSTLSGKFVGAVPRARLQVKGGLATQSKTVAHKPLLELTYNILSLIPVRGPANLQFIEDDSGNLYFIEINPRFGGAYICSIYAGLNACQFILNEFSSTSISFVGYRESLTMVRFWSEFYE